MCKDKNWIWYRSWKYCWADKKAFWKGSRSCRFGWIKNRKAMWAGKIKAYIWARSKSESFNHCTAKCCKENRIRRTPARAGRRAYTKRKRWTWYCPDCYCSYRKTQGPAESKKGTAEQTWIWKPRQSPGVNTRTGKSDSENEGRIWAGTKKLRAGK